MNAVVNFAFEENLVRVVDLDGEPWFVGKDVCHALGISKYRDALATLDQDEGRPVQVDTLGGNQDMIGVSEPGVYRLVFRSRKPEAERFKRWLAHEVLPAIRRTGSYGAPREAERLFEPGVEALLAARVEAVRLALRLYGRPRARAVWRALALPEVDGIDAGGEDDAAAAALNVLLAMQTPAGPLDAALRDGATEALRTVGVRPEDGGFWVAGSHAAPRAALAAFPHWQRLLASLPGGRARIMRFGPLVARAVFVSLPAP